MEIPFDEMTQECVMERIFDKMTQKEKRQAYVSYVVNVVSFCKTARVMSYEDWCKYSDMYGYPYEEDIPEVL